MRSSEVVIVAEAIDVIDILRFLYYPDISAKLLLLLLLRKHSKNMYVKCLHFPCLITNLAACMHACILHVLSVRPN